MALAALPQGTRRDGSANDAAKSVGTVTGGGHSIPLAASTNKIQVRGNQVTSRRAARSVAILG
jgi:hypothetical protein